MSAAWRHGKGRSSHRITRVRAATCCVAAPLGGPTDVKLADAKHEAESS